jgi:hypothetical protein
MSCVTDIWAPNIHLATHTNHSGGRKCLVRRCSIWRQPSCKACVEISPVRLHLTNNSHDVIAQLWHQCGRICDVCLSATYSASRRCLVDVREHKRWAHCTTFGVHVCAPWSYYCCVLTYQVCLFLLGTIRTLNNALCFLRFSKMQFF